MNINNTVREMLLLMECGNFPEKTCQYNKINLFFFQLLYICIAPEEFFFFNKRVGIFSLAAIFSTPASGLLQTIKATSICGVCSPFSTEWNGVGGELNRSMILAALLPAPEAKMAIFFTGQIYNPAKSIWPVKSN